MNTTKLTKLWGEIREDLDTMKRGDHQRRDLILKIGSDFRKAKQLCNELGLSWDREVQRQCNCKRQSADRYLVISKAHTAGRRTPHLGESIEESAKRARLALKLGRVPTDAEYWAGLDPNFIAERLSNYFATMLSKGKPKQYIREVLPICLKSGDLDNEHIDQLSKSFGKLSKDARTYQKELKDARAYKPAQRQLTGLLENAGH